MGSATKIMPPRCGLQLGRELGLAEIRSCSRAFTAGLLLQLGRDLRLAEMPYDTLSDHHPGRASIGRRAEARGNAAGVHGACLGSGASIRPRAEARGNVRSEIWFPGMSV